MFLILSFIVTVCDCQAEIKATYLPIQAGSGRRRVGERGGRDAGWWNGMGGEGGRDSGQDVWRMGKLAEIQKGGWTGGCAYWFAVGIAGRRANMSVAMRPRQVVERTCGSACSEGRWTSGQERLASTILSIFVQ